MRAILIAVLLTACADTGGPVATYRIEALDSGDPDVAEYSRGARVWAELGIVEDPASENVVWFGRNPRLRELVGSDAMADRLTDVVTIDSRVSGFELLVASAHEVGHIVLDTSEHTSCGVMGGIDVALCDEDRALACEAAGFCQ